MEQQWVLEWPLTSEHGEDMHGRGETKQTLNAQQRRRQYVR